MPEPNPALNRYLMQLYRNRLGQFYQVSKEISNTNEKTFFFPQGWSCPQRMPVLKLPKSSSMGAVAIREMSQREARELTETVGPREHHLHAELAEEDHGVL